MKIFFIFLSHLFFFGLFSSEMMSIGFSKEQLFDIQRKILLDIKQQKESLVLIKAQDAPIFEKWLSLKNFLIQIEKKR